MPDQRGGAGNCRFLTMQRCAAARGLHRERCERFAEGYASFRAASTTAYPPVRASCAAHPCGSRSAMTSGGWESSTRSTRPTDHSPFGLWTIRDRSKLPCNRPSTRPTRLLDAPLGAFNNTRPVEVTQPCSVMMKKFRADAPLLYVDSFVSAARSIFRI